MLIKPAPGLAYRRGEVTVGNATLEAEWAAEENGSYEDFDLEELGIKQLGHVTTWPLFTFVDQGAGFYLCGSGCRFLPLWIRVQVSLIVAAYVLAPLHILQR